MSSAQIRREEIYEIMKKEKKIRVLDIRNKFSISGVTANNDLIHLEKRGLIERQFGYAVIKDSKLSLVDESNVENYEKKKELGRHAVKYLSRGESVVFYTSSTIYQLSKCIPDNLAMIVVTNSILIANELGANRQINTILLGGFYNPRIYATYGPQTVKQIDEYNIDKLFISTNGLDSQFGATIDEPFEAELNRALIKNAKTVILIADSTKIGKKRFISVADLNDIDVLITNKDADTEEIKKIRSRGVKIDLV